MKQSFLKKHSNRLFLLYLFLILTISSLYGSVESQKTKVNIKFSKIANYMKVAYEGGEFTEVVKLYESSCCKEGPERDKAKACVEKRGFKNIAKEIRATTYKWLVLSYVALDKPKLANMYLKKLCRVSKPEFEDTFRYIAGQIKDYFEKGKLNEVIDLYNEYCSINKKGKVVKEKKEFKCVSKGIRADIYQWVALSYDALGRPDLVDIYLKRLLDIRYDLGLGNFWPSIRDRVEEKYMVAPRLIFGIKAGLYYTIANPFHRYTNIMNIDSAPGSFYYKDYIYTLNDSSGLQSGIIVEYALTKNYSICLQPALTSLRFRYRNVFVWDADNNIGAEVIHRHKFYYIELPLLLKYRFMNFKLEPYLQIGAYFSYLQFAHKSIDIDKRLSTGTTKDLNLKGLIARFNGGLCAGAGIGCDIGKLRLEIEVNYKLGLNNIVNEDQRYANRELIFGYYDILDDLKLNNWDLAVKILMPISFKAFRR